MAKLKQEIKDEAQSEGARAPKYDRRKNIIAMVVCILIALAIWVYARNIEIKNEQAQTPVGDVQTDQADTTAPEGDA